MERRQVCWQLRNRYRGGFQSQKSNYLEQKSATLITYLHVCFICKVDTIYHKHNQMQTQHF